MTPLEPPSSATVTTAVRFVVTDRSAASDADSPWPPPNATTFGPPDTVMLPSGLSLVLHVSMGQLDLDAVLAHPPGKLGRDRHATVPAAGAADRNCHVVLALADIPLLVASQQCRTPHR